MIYSAIIFVNGMTYIVWMFNE